MEMSTTTGHFAFYTHKHTHKHTYIHTYIQDTYTHTHTHTCIITEMWIIQLFYVKINVTYKP
jgi:hypothetical protein